MKSRMPGLIMSIGIALVSQAHAADETLRFTIDRSHAPHVCFTDLTLKVNALGATAASVVTSTGASVPSSITGGMVVFSTTASDVTVSLTGTTSTAGKGQFMKAVLLGDKKWAWSHGMDDNDYYINETPGFQAKNWFATMFIIG